MFKCPKCESENIRFMTSVILSAPIKYYHNMVKEAYTDKETVIWGVNWGHDIMLCCSACGYVLLDRHSLHDQIDEANKVIKLLREGYVNYPRPVGSGSVCSCKCCKKAWYIDEPEEHEDDCLIEKYNVKKRGN